ncbi:hypothetical protein, partial [Embleya sp. NPDC059237]|uniref:hypothetical protein n=1 Tax=Embleya sp. NPDC059237 TaxID=3346784 RepID=UPI00368CB2F5
MLIRGVPDGLVRPRRDGWAGAGADYSAEYGMRVRLLSRVGADPTSGCGGPNADGTAWHGVERRGRRGMAPDGTVSGS